MCVCVFFFFRDKTANATDAEMQTAVELCVSLNSPFTWSEFTVPAKNRATVFPR